MFDYFRKNIGRELLNFFRINDPYRLIVIFIFLLVIRIPLFIEAPLTLPELSYMLVGEKIIEGAPLYSKIWESLAPLSALVYALSDYLFGRSQLSYHLFAYILICYQAFIFNRMLLESRAYSENTYLPAFIYAILASVCYDMYSLSPFILGITFILLALKNIFSHIEVRAKRDEDILNIGLYVGLATLCYLPFSVFALGVLTIFILFTGTIARRYLLMLFGFLLPMAVAAGYFFLTDRLDDFLYNFFSPFTVIERNWYISLKDTASLFVAPLAFFILAILKVISGARLTNYQSRLTQTILVWAVFSVIFILLADQNTPSVYTILIPPVAFYITHYFLLKNKSFLSEMSFLLFSVLCFATYFLTLSDSWAKNFFDDSNYLIKENTFLDLEGKDILVLDDNLKPYVHAKSATPFLNWQLSQSVFEDLNYYDNLTLIYDGFIDSPPEVIIDPGNLLDDVFEKIPSLKENYERHSDGYYHLKINN